MLTSTSRTAALLDETTRLAATEYGHGGLRGTSLNPTSRVR